MRRYFIATGTVDYPPGFDRLPSVVEDVNRVRGALTSLNYLDALPGLPLNPSSDQLNSIEDWFYSADRQPTDEVVFYYSGHGVSDDRHYLQLGKGMFATEDLFRAAAREPKACHILFLIDTCYAGQVTLDIGVILRSFEQRLEDSRCAITVVTSTRTRSYANVHVFADVLSAVLTSSDRQWGGPNQQYVGLSAILRAIREELPQWQRTKATVFPPHRHRRESIYVSQPSLRRRSPRRA